MSPEEQQRLFANTARAIKGASDATVERHIQNCTLADPAYGEGVRRAIEALAVTPRPPGAIQLAGGDGELRIRVGDYRIIYDIEDDALVVLVLRIGHRGDVYK